MDKQKLEEMNLRMQIIKNGLDAIKNIEEFTTCNKEDRFDVNGVSFEYRRQLETAKKKI